MDSLGYHYYPGTNRLNHVTDQVAAAGFGNGQNDVEDIDNQNAGNYHYDETGNLVKDLAEGIDKITWTVYGKIASIEKANGTNIFYTYDPSGNRISKLVQRSSGDKNYTWYVRDAQGNVMATYTANGQEEDLADLNLKLSERHLYGSSRLGILTETVDVDNNNTGPAETEEEFAITYARGYRQYELSNHLGNVLATVSDKKSGIDSNSDEEIDYFEPEIITASDYYPFGMLMPGRGGSLINGQWQESGPAVLANLVVSSRNGNEPIEYIALESIEFLPGFESGGADEFVAYITTSGNGGSYEGEDGLYRYGFNGKENDNEIKGDGNQIDYGMRVFDPRLGNFLSVDPLANQYHELTPYQYASNSPISGIDLDGLEFQYYNVKYTTEKGRTKLTVGDFIKTADRTVRVSATVKYTHYVARIIPISIKEKVHVDVNYSDIGLSPTVVPVNGIWRVLPLGVSSNDLPEYDDPIWETFETPDEFAERIVITGNQIIQTIDDISSIFNVSKLLSGSVTSGKLGTINNTRDKWTNNTRGWKTGDPINNLTRTGKTPSWSTIRTRHWKNRALNAKDGEFSTYNLERMKKGKAPKIFDPGTGKTESVELHHPKGRDVNNLFNFEELLPSQHAAKDPYRKLKKE